MADIIIVIMEGTARLYQAPRGTRVEIRDYDAALVLQPGEDGMERDDNGEEYHRVVLERQGE